MSTGTFASFANKFTTTRLSMKKMTTTGSAVIDVTDGYFLSHSESHQLLKFAKEQECSSDQAIEPAIPVQKVF